MCEMVEALGDTALISREHNEATARFTSALFLSPPNPTDILVKRSRALWEDSLTDANEVCALCRI